MVFISRFTAIAVTHDPATVFNRPLHRSDILFGRLVDFGSLGIHLGNRLCDVLRRDEILPFIRIKI